MLESIMQFVSFDSSRTPIRLPRQHLRFPIALKTPRGFHLDKPESWPRVEGRLEFVKGELLYTPPCADFQQDVASEVLRLLGNWSVRHPDFLVAGNEAGMLLGGEARGADAAVWRKHDVGPHRGVFRRTPPVLAVEVAGEDEDEPALRRKAAWYLEHGVTHVWLVFPRTRSVLANTADAWETLRGRAKLVASGLPGLRLAVSALFRQLER